MQRLLLDSRIILCTLSMLSNDKISTIVKIVPVETIIFDEASQIEIGGYLPVIHRFASSLRKMVFIGDDKQLPPYGQSDIPDLESVFEKQHLRRKMHFLDTQYRMPTPIGDFISEHVYNKKLKTIHEISSKTCCRFVNVSSGQEKQRSKSWIVSVCAKCIVSTHLRVNSERKGNSSCGQDCEDTAGPQQIVPGDNSIRCAEVCH
ncbi:hypothetical protein ARMSODRAFT_403857 [Armillaria solidipes]|uniref:DNA2/NAM7 helicase helicase domain-containing protein n=1 Tax=Armillaria solidipes TaxID=1076256 RepID=A0A2H3CK65_9AGAR|nr:hypothetical protein ARMSODRAFT_403857 [Armillaria solidipes]